MEVGASSSGVLGQTAVINCARVKSISSQNVCVANRFAFVDGLRGLAALAIVIFHIWWYSPEPNPLVGMSHSVIDTAVFRARGGVQVLLVISGFVIAYTLRSTQVTFREILWFIGRRLIRLVPTYWTAIGIIIVVDSICNSSWSLPSPFDGHLTIQRISAHMTFLQDILGHEALGAGMWTICIEMQFYLVAILAWGLAQRFTAGSGSERSRPSLFGLLSVYVPFAFASLFFWRPLESTSPWVIHFFWMFFLGMMAWWTIDRTVPVGLFLLVAAVAAIELVYDPDWRYENSVALATAIAILTAGRLDRLDQWLNWSWLQHFGKISYSLYLVHFPVSHLLTSAGWWLFGNSPTSIQALTILLFSFVSSLLAADVLYKLVEAPSIRWASNLKRLQSRSISSEPQFSSNGLMKA